MTSLQAQRLMGRAAGALWMIAFVPSICSAEVAAGSALKAAFTLNFVKFTEWPERAPGHPIVVCVPSAGTMAGAMTETMSGQSVGGRAIHVVLIEPDDAVRDCNVLFVTERDPLRLAAILKEAARLPMLTVSDSERSLNGGAMIEFFMESGRLRFAINADTVNRSRLKVSSRVLSLAKIVRDRDTP